MNYKTALINFLLFVLSVIVLTNPALINGYPLVYSDTGCYIASGQDGNVPIDRPILYGLFILYISMSYSLWFIILAQAIIITSLILIFFQSFSKSSYNYLKTLIAITILSFTTGLSNYVSQIMPDIFSAVMIVAIGLFFCAHNLSMRVKIYLSILILFSNLVHSSNLITSTCLIILFLFIGFIFKNKKVFLPKPSVIIAGIIVVFSVWIILPTVNFLYNSGFNVSRSKNIFIMGRLVESGIIATYLDDKCEEQHFQLCDYKNKLPQASYQFLWNSDSSPLYTGGCIDKGWKGNWGNCWIEKNIEYAPIINDILTSPRYLNLVIKSSFKEALNQLITFDIGELIPMMEGSPVLHLIKRHYPHEQEQYIASRQAREILYFTILSKIQNVVMAISTIILLLFFIANRVRRKLPMEIKVFCLITIFGLILNAVVCSAFSGALNRYEGRVIWLLPLVVIFILSEFYYNNKIKTTE